MGNAWRWLTDDKIKILLLSSVSVAGPDPIRRPIQIRVDKDTDRNERDEAVEERPEPAQESHAVHILTLKIPCTCNDLLNEEGDNSQ